MAFDWYQTRWACMTVNGEMAPKFKNESCESVNTPSLGEHFHWIPCIWWVRRIVTTQRNASAVDERQD